MVNFSSYLLNKKITFEKLKFVSVGGEKILYKDMEIIKRSLHQNTRLFNSYGITETAISSTFYEYTDCDLHNKVDIIPLGNPFPNVELYILDEFNKLKPFGSVGELYIGGKSVGLGYLNNDNLTDKKFITTSLSKDRLYSTGDLVRWNSKFELEYIGRVDDQIKFNGYRIDVKEIENAFLDYKYIDDVIIDKISNEFGNSEEIVAYVVSLKEKKINFEELHDFLKTKINSYIIPSRIVVINSIPLTQNGKIDKKTLKTREENNLINLNNREDKGRLIPRNMNELRMLELWQKVLLKTEIGLDKNFFRIGGHSILALKLQAEIQKEFKCEINIGKLFEFNTIEAMVKLVEEHSKNTNLKYNNVIKLKEGSLNSPYFFIHQISGYCFRYIQLANSIENDQAIFGIQIANPSGDTNNLKIMASNYIKEIRKIIGSGDINLVGHSLGGNIAFEMALQLKDSDLNVNFLGIIDSHISPFKNKISEIELFKEYVERFNLSEKDVNLFLTLSKKEKVEEILKLGIKQNQFSPDLSLKRMSQMIEAYLNLNNAWYIYQMPKNRYNGNVHFFKAQLNPIDSTKGWDQLFTKKMKIHEFLCTHDSIMEGSVAKRVGEIINKFSGELTFEKNNY